MYTYILLVLFSTHNVQLNNEIMSIKHLYNSYLQILTINEELIAPHIKAYFHTKTTITNNVRCLSLIGLPVSLASKCARPPPFTPIRALL